MTASEFTAPPGSGAWQRYLAHEHAARDAYLQTTAGAHREYLTGPWPDRQSYEAVERSAWVNYYAAGRAAWQTYTREVAPPPPPVVPPVSASYPYPLAGETLLSVAHQLDGPQFTPHPEGRPEWPSN